MQLFESLGKGKPDFKFKKWSSINYFDKPGTSTWTSDICAMPWAAKDKLETAVLWRNSHIETFPRLVHSDELLFLCLLLATCRRTQTNSHTTYSTRPSGGPLRRKRSSKTVQWLQSAAGSLGGCKPAPSESPPRLTVSNVPWARVIAHQFTSSLPSSSWGGISSSLNRCTTVPFAS